MAKITNPWLNPLQRSYQQIKTKLMEGLASIKDKDGKQLVTDFSEGNILIIILSMFAAVAEVLHYYIDNMARETFFSTARKYESLVKHAALVDYHPNGATAASVDVIITRNSDDNSNGSTIDIPEGLVFNDSSGNPWYNYKATKWYPNTTSVSLSLIQHQPHTISELIGLVIPIVDNPVINVPGIDSGKFYEEGTMTLVIDGITWTLVDTFAYSKPSDKHFMVLTDSSQNVSIVFGDGKFGSKPESGKSITNCTCYITAGANSNIGPNSIKSVPTQISTKSPTASCTNPYSAAGGSNYEDFNLLKTRIPLSTRTMGVAITKQDFIDLALLTPGVSKAALEYECGRKMNIYIAGIGGTIASRALCNQVLDSLSNRAPLTTWLTVNSVGVSDMVLNITVTGKKGFSTRDITNQVTNALLNRYSPTNAEIGYGVRMSDMYALIDNLSMVDYLTIHEFYLKPWPKTLYGNTSLTIGGYKLIKSPDTPVEYLVTFNSSTTYSIVSKDGAYRLSDNVTGSTAEIKDDYHGVHFTWDIPSSIYSHGHKYSVTISKSNTDIDNIGYNLAVFTDPANQLVLNINETV